MAESQSSDAAVVADSEDTAIDDAYRDPSGIAFQPAVGAVELEAGRGFGKVEGHANDRTPESSQLPSAEAFVLASLAVFVRQRRFRETAFAGNATDDAIASLEEGVEHASYWCLDLACLLRQNSAQVEKAWK